MKPVAEVARERNTTIEDVLVHLKRAGMELADGQTEVDEDSRRQGLRHRRRAAPAGRVPAAAAATAAAAS